MTNSTVVGHNVCRQDLLPCVAVFCSVKDPVSLHLFYLQQVLTAARRVQVTTILRLFAEQTDTRRLLEYAFGRT